MTFLELHIKLATDLDENQVGSCLTFLCLPLVLKRLGMVTWPCVAFPGIQTNRFTGFFFAQRGSFVVWFGGKPCAVECGPQCAYLCVCTSICVGLCMCLGQLMTNYRVGLCCSLE